MDEVGGEVITYPKEYPIRLVRNNWNKISRYYCEVVVVKMDFEMVIQGRIDQSKSIFLVFCEGGRGILPPILAHHRSVNEAIISNRWPVTRCLSCYSILVCRPIIPVLDGFSLLVN